LTKTFKSNLTSRYLAKTRVSQIEPKTYMVMKEPFLETKSPQNLHGNERTVFEDQITTKNRIFKPKFAW
jgi:hypothetical protein